MQTKRDTLSRRLLALLAALALAGCASSPEAARPRGAGLGSGADPRNYPPGGPAPASKVFVIGGEQDQGP
jgi:hypothetical protein